MPFVELSHTSLFSIAKATEALHRKTQILYQQRQVLGLGNNPKSSNSLPVAAVVYVCERNTLLFLVYVNVATQGFCAREETERFDLLSGSNTSLRLDSYE